MKKLKDYGLDDQIGLGYAKKYFLLKSKSKEELKELGYKDNLIDKILNSVCGYMHINKISPDSGNSEQGWCGLFGEGLSCILNMGSRWYHTSLVKNIDWDKHIFHTENSEYKFRIDRYNVNDILNYINENSNSK